MIIVTGLAGSGKTTQGQLLAKYLDISWISTGRLLRQHADAQAQKEMLEGKIVDDEIILSMLKKQFEAKQLSQKDFVLDGCPRSLRQAEWLADLIKNGQIKFGAFINLEMEPATAHDRLLARGRHDDHKDAIAERFNEYKTTILPIFDYLEKRGVKIDHVSGEGTIEEVATRIHKVLNI